MFARFRCRDMSGVLRELRYFTLKDINVPVRFADELHRCKKRVVERHQTVPLPGDRVSDIVTGFLNLFQR